MCAHIDHWPMFTSTNTHTVSQATTAKGMHDRQVAIVGVTAAAVDYTVCVCARMTRVPLTLLPLDLVCHGHLCAGE